PGAPTTPSPVITTRRGTRRLARPLGEDEVDERVHRAEGPPPDLLVGDRDLEAVLDQHHQLERVDRVEAERLSEDGRVVGDVGRGDLEPEPAREEVLHLAAEGVGIHGRPCLEHREAAVHVKRGPGDVGGRGRGEEEDGGGDLLGTGEAAERDLPRELVAPRQASSATIMRGASWVTAALLTRMSGAPPSAARSSAKRRVTAWASATSARAACAAPPATRSAASVSSASAPSSARA